MRSEIFRAIEKEYSEISFDDALNICNRSIELHLASLRFAKKIWGKSLTYEKSEYMLINQFPEFKKTIVSSALSKAYIHLR